MLNISADWDSHSLPFTLTCPSLLSSGFATPNPTFGGIFVEYTLNFMPTTLTSMTVNVIEPVSGNILKTFILSDITSGLSGGSLIGQYPIDLSDLQTGIYDIILTAYGQSLAPISINVIKH